MITFSKDVVSFADDLIPSIRERYDRHLSSDRADEEYGWLLLGYRGEDGTVMVKKAIAAGGEYRATRLSFDYDKVWMAERIKAIIDGDNALQVIGSVHTHPNGQGFPSRVDLEGDSVWVSHMPGPVITAIACTRDGETLINWFLLNAGDKYYTRVEVPS